MTARHSSLFTLRSGQSGLRIYTTRRDAAPDCIYKVKTGFIGILGGLPPTLHLLRVQAPFPAVGAELGGVQTDRLQHHCEFVGSRPALWFLLGCRHHLSLQPPRLPPVVEGDNFPATGGELDLEVIHAVNRQKDPRGEKACWEEAAFRVLTGNQQPDHSRISDFRRRHLGALAGLFVQVLRLCQKAGLVSLGQVALDGAEIKANTS